jgi:hypothetical protein
MDHAVAGVRVALDIGFHAAHARLRILARGTMLLHAAEVAYSQGITGLVELAGPAAGVTRLADVCAGDLTPSGEYPHVALQWDAIAADGTLFTALLADLMLSWAADDGAVLTMTGSYWPPPGPAYAVLDEADLRGCATVIMGSFLQSVACELAHPAGTAAG